MPLRPQRRVQAGTGPILVVVLAMPLLLGFGTAGGPARGSSGFTSTPAPVYPISWVEIGPDGAQIARLIVPGDDCPRLVTNDTSQPMQVRVGVARPAFDNTVCEAVIPSGARSASLSTNSAIELPLLNAPPRRIAVIGDTGCRLNAYDGFQACNDEQSWPFSTIAAEVARWNPDLIIHVGDYLYREAPCPAGNSGCVGSPFGDTFATWQADFFGPAIQPLRNAPWLFLRGNHEICDRAGAGWFRYLDPRPIQAACQEFTEPYAITLGELRLVVLDSAEAGDERSSAAETAAYQQQFDDVASLATDGTWLLTHKPIWGVIENSDGNRIEVRTESFEAAMADDLPPGIDLVISGHIHLSEVLLFDPASDRPAQLVVGNGGTALDRNVTAPLTGKELDDATLTAGETTDRFGFLTIETSSDGWLATERDVDGNPGTTCTITEGRVDCSF